MKLLATLLFLTSLGFAQVPDAPVPVPAKPRVVHFYTYRTRWQDPALRSSKQVFQSKIFWMGAAADLTVMSIACRNKNSGEEFHSELPAVLAIQGFKYVTFRWMSALYGPGMDTYAVIHYSLSERK